MWYTYILRSQKDGKTYIGSTNDLKRRFKEHNDGLVRSTIHRTPFSLEAYVAVKTEERARALEKYSNVNANDSHKGTSKNSHLARCGRFLKAQKEFLNGGVSSGYAERRTFFLEPKRTATRRETDSYGFRRCRKHSHSPLGGCSWYLLLAVSP